MTIIGIDNGVTGSIGVRDKFGLTYHKMPIKNHLNYQKTKAKHINRIDFSELCKILTDIKYLAGESSIRALLERPMINPMRFEASVSASRAFEATLIALEEINIPYEFIDSKEWQDALLPKVTKEQKQSDKNILKKLATEVLWNFLPNLQERKVKDAEGVLIAEYGYRKLVGKICI